MITQSSAVSIHIRFFDWRGFISRRTFSTFFHASFSSKWLERKNKTDTVSLKLPNLQCIKMFNSYSSHSCIYEKSSSKMYAIENCLPLPPPKKKGVALRGFLGTCPSVKKMCTNLQSKQMRCSRPWLRSRKDVKLNFLLCSLPIYLFIFSFQSPVKGITLNEKLSTFSFFLFHLSFFLLV